MFPTKIFFSCIQIAHLNRHLGRYLTFKEDGKFLANADSAGKEEALIIEPQPDGRWAFKTARGYYIGGTGENLDAYTKELREDRIWKVQLAIHPQ